MDPNRPLDRSDLVPMTGGGVSLGMQMDWICMESDPDITCYHILIGTRVQIQIFANMNTKRIYCIHISIRIFTQFNSMCILLNSTYINKILLLSSSITEVK
jgi:hypothetical protein